MENYRYTSLDVAAYIKWTHLAADTELNFMVDLWPARSLLLADRCLHSFLDFRHDVNEQLYYLDERGFVDEHSDLLLVKDGAGHHPALLPAELFRFETELKLLALHLIRTPQLPYVSRQVKLPAEPQAPPRTLELAEQLLEFSRSLGVVIAKENGFPWDAYSLMNEKTLLFGLSAAYVTEVQSLLPIFPRFQTSIEETEADGPEV